MEEAIKKSRSQIIAEMGEIICPGCGKPIEGWVIDQRRYPRKKLLDPTAKFYHDRVCRAMRDFQSGHISQMSKAGVEARGKVAEKQEDYKIKDQ